MSEPYKNGIKAPRERRSGAGGGDRRTSTASSAGRVTHFESQSGRPVDESNDNARANPLNEVGHCLEQRQPEPNIQTHVVVEHERASGKDSDQEAKTHPLGDGGAIAKGEGIKSCERHHRQEQGHHTDRSHALHGLWCAVHGRELADLVG